MLEGSVSDNSTQGLQALKEANISQFDIDLEKSFLKETFD